MWPLEGHTTLEALKSEHTSQMVNLVTLGGARDRVFGGFVISSVVFLQKRPPPPRNPLPSGRVGGSCAGPYQDPDDVTCTGFQRRAPFPRSSGSFCLGPQVTLVRFFSTISSFNSIGRQENLCLGGWWWGALVSRVLPVGVVSSCSGTLRSA